MHYSPATGLSYHHMHKTGGLSVKAFLSGALPDFAPAAEWPHRDP